MDGSNFTGIAPVVSKDNPDVPERSREQAEFTVKKNQETTAERVKDYRRMKLRRRVYQDPSMFRKLVAIEASPVYNMRGEVSLAVASSGIGEI